VAFTGLGLNNSEHRKNDVVAVVEKNQLPVASGRPLRVVAFMYSYNEADIIVPSLQRLINQGIEVYLIDNWSTDSTYDLAKQFEGRGLVGLERFPKQGPAQYFNLRDLLGRIEVLAREVDADWFIHNDVDLVQVPPWVGVSLKEGIRRVDDAGYNAIDHTVIVFHPVDNNYPPGTDFEAYFRYFDFGKRPGHFLQIKAWKNLRRTIFLADFGDHEVQFEGRRVYPYKFLMKHYPVRSQEHGERKIFADRIPRWNPKERANGWHIQYDDLKSGHVFLRSTSDLMFYDEVKFNEKFLIERLSGIGIL
jgi:glycosyltransferase involved in cell wall biosynthesis